jgi:hypothetical protein
MLVKFEKESDVYIVDSNNKQAILKIAEIYYGGGARYKLIDTKHGGYADPKLESELILNTNLFRNGFFSTAMSTIQTPYGRYVCNALTVYNFAFYIYSELKRIEDECKACDALQDSGETISQLPNVCDIDELDKMVDNPPKHQLINPGEALRQLGITEEMSEDELNFIYAECLHELCKYFDFDVKSARFALIDKGKLSKTREKYAYLRDNYYKIKEKEIKRAKEKYFAE